MHKSLNSLIVRDLADGGVGVLPTDTIYGIVGSALDKEVVQRIYRLRRRNAKKPMIILIGSINDVKKFGVRVTPAVKKILGGVWPGAVSVVMPIGLPNAQKNFAYLHRKSNTLAFRLPKPLWLRSLLKKTGPLVAPSANFEGQPPARTIMEAKGYFKDNVRFYVDAGRLASKPSTLIQLINDTPIVLRKGAVPIRLL